MTTVYDNERKEYMRIYYQKNKNKAREYARAYNQKHRKNQIGKAHKLQREVVKSSVTLGDIQHCPMDQAEKLITQIINGKIKLTM